MKILFTDWSGVVSDDTKTIYRTTVCMLKYFGYSEAEDIEYDQWLDHSRSLEQHNPVAAMKFYGIQAGEDEICIAQEKYITEHSNNGIAPVPYADAVSTLVDLADRGVSIYVISSHPSRNVKNESERYGLSGKCKIIGGCRDKAVVLKQLCAEIGTYQVPFLGDTKSDVIAGQKAGVITVAVEGGYHSREMLESAKPDYIIGKFSDILLLNLE